MDPTLLVPMLAGIAALLTVPVALRNSRTGTTAQNLAEIRTLAEEARASLTDTRATLRETQATLREAQSEIDTLRRRSRDCEDCLARLQREVGHTRRAEDRA